MHSVAAGKLHLPIKWCADGEQTEVCRHIVCSSIDLDTHLLKNPEVGRYLIAIDTDVGCAKGIVEYRDDGFVALVADFGGEVLATGQEKTCGSDAKPMNLDHEL